MEWSLRAYGTEPQIWDGDPMCNHDWSTIIRPKARGNSHGDWERNSRSAGLNEPTESDFCSKCGAWRGELGLEPYIDLYVKHLCDIFDEVYRVLAEYGILWVNIADTYYGSGSGHKNGGKQDRPVREGAYAGINGNRPTQGKELPAKCLSQVPARFEIEMVRRGWIKRSELIWWKESVIPESVKDRPTVDYEKIFFFVKNVGRLFYTHPDGRISTAPPEKTDENEGIDWEWITQRSGRRIRKYLWHSHDYYYKQQFEPIKQSSIDRYKLAQQGAEIISLDQLRSRKGNREMEMIAAGQRVGPVVGGKKYTDNPDEVIGADRFSGEPMVGRMNRNMRCVMNVPTAYVKEAHFACVDENTEVLTRDGWKNIDELTLEHEICTLNIIDETLHYHRPYDIYRYDYDGEIISIKGGRSNIDMMMTPNHRVLLKSVRRISKTDQRNKTDDLWNYVRADRMKRRSGLRLPVAGKYSGGSTEIDKNTAAVIGWLITDGWLTANTFCISQSMTKNPDKVALIRENLKMAGIDFSERTRNRRHRGRDYEMTQFYIYTHSANKVLRWINENKRPSWELLHANREVLETLYKTIILADGSTRDDGRESFIQIDDYNRMWFRILCLHLNKSTTEFKTTRKHSRGCVYVNHRNYIKIHPSRFNSWITSDHYKGKVWCPHLPNSNFVARRNGFIFITGNTFPPNLIRPLIDAGTPKQVCTKCGLPRMPIIDTVAYGEFTDRSTEKPVGKDSFEAGAGHKEGGFCTTNHETLKEHKLVGWTKCDCGAPFRSGILLDPFMGSGTSGMVAKELGLYYIGIDLKPEYVEMSERRIDVDQTRLDDFL